MIPWRPDSQLYTRTGVFCCKCQHGLYHSRHWRRFHDPIIRSQQRKTCRLYSRTYKIYSNKSYLENMRQAVRPTSIVCSILLHFLDYIPQAILLGDLTTILNKRLPVNSTLSDLDNVDVEGGCDLDYVPNKGIEMNIDAAMSATFGFGGHNGAIIIKKVK